MCLVAREITYLLPNRPPGLIDTRFHTKVSLHQKECNNPLCNNNNHLCNLYGTDWYGLQCITSWPFWLWIMAVTWLHLPLTFSRLGLRNLGMWAWARTLKVYKAFTEVGLGSRLKRILCRGPTGVINCTPLSTLSFWWVCFPESLAVTPSLCFFVLHSTHHRLRWCIFVYLSSSFLETHDQRGFACLSTAAAVHWCAQILESV